MDKVLILLLVAPCAFAGLVLLVIPVFALCGLWRRHNDVAVKNGITRWDLLLLTCLSVIAGIRHSNCLEEAMRMAMVYGGIWSFVLILRYCLVERLRTLHYVVMYFTVILLSWIISVL